ncbi:hypothetical protein HII17_12725 [Thalassotalea sp. M1531]|uniref:histidine kinase n=1 Tax=Thalassotalea algicola TaxID=2716224 RepID=A0A7Y0LDA0_9GAMM|nr:ATP-binding protein [Thalassotalea algicola]NMP32428.1 hypothetical protein [Thalassotalea algicola]
MKNLFLRLYILLILTFVGLGWSIEIFYSNLSNEEQITSDLALHKGTFMLLNAELMRHPENEQHTHLEALSTSFGYPIALLNEDKIRQFSNHTGLALGTHQINYLSSGGVISLFNDIKGESWFLKKLSDRNGVMVLGPIYTEPVVQSDIIYTGLFFIGLAVFVFLWVWPISKGLMSLTNAATEFGKGNFEVRANTHVSSSLLELVERFNSMAARIQRLIKSHRELSHAVSHELRTPIARIRFAMEIIREEDNAELKHKYLDSMDESIEELDSLVDELLVYAKFDREEPQLKIKEYNLVIFLNDIIEKYRLNEPRFQFHLNVENLVSANKVNASFDREGMNKVIDNLLRNAVRYAKKRISISVTIEQEKLVLKVSDDGVGIPQEKRDSIFEPFVRLDESRDKKSGGIGLGLAIVKRFVELHQGQITIESAKGGGACFNVTWPQ